jgi:hypothetical protein
MADEVRVKEYIGDLRARVHERSLELSEDGVIITPRAFGEAAFTHVAAEVLQDLGQLADPQFVYLERRFGRYAAKLNGWAFDEEEGRLDLVSTLWDDRLDESAVPSREIVEAAKRAVRAFLAASMPVHAQMEPASEEHDAMHRFHELQGQVQRIRVLLLVDAAAAAADRVEFEEAAPDVQLEVWDVMRLFRAESAGSAYESIRIDLVDRLGSPLPCLPAPHSGAAHECYLAVLPGDLVHSIYHEYGARLLELNVRSFLQVRGKVNRGIRETLRDAPEYFLAYNNGLSATAEQIEIVESADGRPAIRSITGLQVVNGGQTVASIHRAKQQDHFDIGKVSVQAKITVVNSHDVDTLVPRISRFANTQNRVNEADFSANHTFHVRLQQLSETVWTPGEQHRWFYERARGQYQVARAREGSTPARRKRFDTMVPPRQRFDKVLLAKYVNSWHQLPHILSRGGQKNFVEFMLRLSRERPRDWEPEADDYKRIIAQAIIFRQAEKIARTHAFPAYRANAVAYTVSLVSYRTAGRVNLLEIWRAQECSKVLSDTMHDWAPVVLTEIIDSADGRNITEWAKQEGCWRHVQTIGVTVPARLERQLAEGQPLPTVGSEAGKRGHGLSPADRENIARVMQVTPEQWLYLVSWGGRSGELKDWQVGIASTLASYAATGWSKVPSVKQARQGVEMLSLATDLSDWIVDE